MPPWRSCASAGRPSCSSCRIRSAAPKIGASARRASSRSRKCRRRSPSAARFSALCSAASAISATNIGRAGTAARSATRIGRESQDVARAEESLEVLQQRLEGARRAKSKPKSRDSRARSTPPLFRCATSKCRRASPTSPSAKSHWSGRRGARAPTVFLRPPTTEGFPHERAHRPVDQEPRHHRRAGRRRRRRPVQGREGQARTRRSSTVCLAACPVLAIS